MAVKRAKLGQNPGGFRHISTRLLPAVQRFDFWRNVHAFIDLDVVREEKRKNFSADVMLYQGQDGSTFGYVSSDDVATRFARSHDEYLMFSLCLSGTAKVRTDTDKVQITKPSSGLVIMDGTRQANAITEDHSHVYLTVPKAMIDTSLAAGTSLLRDGICGLPSKGLADLLMSYLVMVARQSSRLDPQAAAVAVKAAVDLAVGSLAQADAPHDWLPDERHDDAFYAGACRYIALHLGDADLTSARIAHALGCSRAHLYRVFAGRGEGIGEVIRAARLERAAVLLGSSAAIPISQIATACGFVDPSAFTRWFREQHGLTPTAFRAQARNK